MKKNTVKAESTIIENAVENIFNDETAESVKAENVNAETVGAIETAETVKAETVKGYEIEPLKCVSADAKVKARFDKLYNYIQTVESADGTTRGKLSGLSAKDFSSKDASDNYKLELANVVFFMVKASEFSDDAERNNMKSKARKSIQKAYDILCAECGIPENAIPARAMKNFISLTGWAKLKINYKDMFHEMKSSTINDVNKFIHISLYDAIHGIENYMLHSVNLNDSIKKTIATAEQKAADDNTPTSVLLTMFDEKAVREALLKMRDKKNA